MDPAACFERFQHAAQAAADYAESILKGGFAHESDGERVVVLDVEQDRYGVCLGSGLVPDKWRTVLN